MEEYLYELRKNREFKANKILKDCLDNNFWGTNKKLLRDISLIQNRTRGPLFELMAEIIIGKVFGVSEFDKQTVFSTPYGRRKIDLFIPDQSVAIEIKSGYARLKNFIKKQILKDNYILINDPGVKQIVWVCFRGATKPLVTYLKKNCIDYVDVEYDRLGDQGEAIKKILT